MMIVHNFSRSETSIITKINGDRKKNNNLEYSSIGIRVVFGYKIDVLMLKKFILHENLTTNNNKTNVVNEMQKTQHNFHCGTQINKLPYNLFLFRHKCSLNIRNFSIQPY